MKAVNRFLYMAAAVVALFATSCLEQIEPTPAPKVDGQQVYFAVNQKTNFVIDDNTSVEIPLYRIVADEAYTASLLFEGEAGINAPAAPSFAAGETQTKVVVTFDPESFTAGQTKSFKLLLAADTTPYGDGASDMTFTITMPEPWNSLGIGTYRDDFLLPLYGGPAGVSWSVEILQHAEKPNLYRVVNPFSEDIIKAIFGGVPGDMMISELEGYIELDVTNPNNVLIPSSPCGFMLDPGIGEMVDFYLTNYNDEESTGVFADGIITFAPGSLLWHIPDGRGNYANQSGLFAVVLPGYTLLDASISAAYAGMTVNADASEVNAIFEFVLGADVDSYKFVVVPGNKGNDYADVVAGLVDGSIEGITSTADQTKWSVELETGYYTLVAVPYVGEEAKVDQAFANYFYFAGVNGSETPKPEFDIELNSIANFSDLFDPETFDALIAKYPENYYVALKIAGNGSEMRTMKAWIGDAATVDGSGLDWKDIVSNYGGDFTQVIADVEQKGIVVLGPYNFMSGTKATALIAIETIYGTTEYFRSDCAMPYSGNLAIGEYLFTNGDSSLNVTLTGGYSDDQAALWLSGFDNTAFIGAIDQTNKVITFPGIVDGIDESVFNDLYDYYDADRTMAYGFYVSETGKFDDNFDKFELTFDENGVINGFNYHFGCFVFNMSDGQQLGTAFYFSPETVVAPAPTAEPSAKVLSVKPSTRSELTLIETVRSYPRMNGKVYNGEIKRENIHRAAIL